MTAARAQHGNTRRAARAANDWFVYLIRTEAGTLYTGITKDVARRRAMHETQRGAKFLRGRGALTVVYERKLGSRALASRVEYALKRIRKAEKESIVRSTPSRARLLRKLGIEAKRDA